MPNNYISRSATEAPPIIKDDAVAIGGTWDPTFNSGSVSLSGDLLTAGTSLMPVRGTAIMNGGKHYFEVLVNSWSGAYGPLIGIMGEFEDNYGSPNAYSVWTSHGKKYHGPAETNSGFSIGVGDRVGFLFDQDAGTLVFYKNGVSQGVAYSGIPFMRMRAHASGAGSAYGASVTANFGGSPFM